MTVTIQKKTIESCINDIQNTIIVAEHNHDIWWIYKSKDTRPKYLDVMNSYKGFFQTSIHAHFVAMIIALYRLYENRRDTVSIPRLLTVLNHDSHLSDDVNKHVTDLMLEVKPIWIKIGIVRSEVFAHLTDERSVEDSFKKADIKYHHFNDLIELSKIIINIITYEYIQNTHVFNLSAESDTKAFLSDLLELWRLRNMDD